MPSPTVPLTTRATLSSHEAYQVGGAVSHSLGAIPVGAPCCRLDPFHEPKGHSLSSFLLFKTRRALHPRSAEYMRARKSNFLCAAFNL